MRPVVLLDCDGVMADFLGRAIEVIRLVYGLDIERSDVTNWTITESIPHPHRSAALEAAYHEVLNQRGFCASIRPFPGVLDAVEQLREHADVYAVTAPMRNPFWMPERNSWLEHHLKFPHDRINHVTDKFLVQGDVLVDDRPSNVRDWVRCQPKGRAFLWAAPYNAGTDLDGCRTECWGDVVEYVADLHGTSRVFDFLSGAPRGTRY